MRPLETGGPLEARADFQRAVERICDALEPHYSPGNARLRPGVTGTLYPDVDAELEGFARRLWGALSLEAGGRSVDDWERIREGLANGCNPDHDEYWGTPGDHSQKHVEMSTIAVALAVVPERIWDPLASEEQRLVADWLGRTNEARLWDGNWLFYRVLTNLGLESVGAEHDPEQVRSDLDRLDSYYMSDGWYSDGTDDGLGGRDHYIAWEMHVNGLLYAALADDPDRASTFRERARRFAGEYVHWFAGDGPALPYGRSLTYRFAQAAFWGALAFADAKPDALSWGQIRGLWARNVRWWLDQPIFTEGGVLSIGYRYPNLKAAEIYNSPSGPYWALKAALPLACPPDHPFWRAEEEPLPDLPDVTVQEEPNLLVCRDEETDHHFALAAGQSHLEGDFSAEPVKYNKFAYSTAFGVGVASGLGGLLGAGHDSALVLSEDGRSFRHRERVRDQSVGDGAAYSRWEPFDDVSVETWLVPALPWHARVHRIESERTLHSAEGGFALDRTGDDDPASHDHLTEENRAVARYPAGVSAVVDARGERETDVAIQDSNVNVLHQRTVVPTLTGEHEPGETWLATAVVGVPGADADAPWDAAPAVSVDGDRFTVTSGDGDVLYEGSASL
ncbi:DUF2264 domain-containing protein [Halomicrobium salinisoli]|uniref:DUF2264 domain-containing protein n=1 Tax=Halomicrobium salinisoli TaxID=2878391 RepID=UPI001CF0A800|nr:DUF2264 domain-containing protein [Halomicrobium salinisoli]